MNESQQGGVSFIVKGAPMPKQSFRYDGNGHGHTDSRIKAWQEEVLLAARQAMAVNKLDVYSGNLMVQLAFCLPDKRRKDLDNLSKAVLDGCNHVVWEDDKQIVDLHLSKYIGDTPGVTVMVWEAPE